MKACPFCAEEVLKTRPWSANTVACDLVEQAGARAPRKAKYEAAGVGCVIQAIGVVLLFLWPLGTFRRRVTGVWFGKEQVLGLWAVCQSPSR